VLYAPAEIFFIRPSLKSVHQTTGRGTIDPEVQSGDAPQIPGYRLHEELGRSGDGKVYKALQVATHRTVALKILPFCEGTEKAAAALMRELRVIERLRHPNIIRGYDAGINGGYFYIAMEYVRGRPLRVTLDHDGALPIPQALSITRQIANALAHAWEVGLVHRDVKPDNIILAKDYVAKLADLGVSRDLTGVLNTVSTEGVVLGDPLYISPEQVHGMGGIDWRADVYGLGASLYHMVCGDTPFDRRLSATSLMEKHVSEEPVPAHQRNENVPLPVSQLIQKMMQKKPDDRYATADQLLGDCERVSIGLPPESPVATKGT